MILYHGSYVEVKHPDIKYSRNNVDFGKGFYTTPIYEQAVNWAARFKKKKGASVVTTFEIEDPVFDNNLQTKKFESYSEEWLEFIIACRREECKEEYDIVIGGVANDKVFDTIELFFDGLIEKKVAIERLRFLSPNLQICFRNQVIIDKYLIYVRSEVLE